MAHRLDVRTARFGLLAAALLTAACAAPIRGVVVEEGSGQPLAGTTVYAKWTASGSAAGVDSRSFCTRIDFATTDAQGRFELPGNLSVLGQPTAWVEAYRPGYVRVLKIDPYGNYADLKPLPAEQKIVMKPFLGTVKERLDVLGQHANYKALCGKPEETKKKLIPFYRALYDDARDFAIANRTSLTEQDKQGVRDFAWIAESAELGMDEADRRMTERRQRGQY